MFIVMLTTGVALLLACVVFVSYDVVTFRKTLANTLGTLAGIIGKNSTASLEFNDPASAEDILSALSAAPNIQGACIYRTDGSIFATYDRPDSETETFPAMSDADGSYLKGRTFHAFKKITLGNEVIGTVYVESSLKVLIDRLWGFIWMVVVVFIISWLLAVFLSSKLQKLVSGPILQLVQMAREVARHKNYSLRAVKVGEDELGVLVDNFNGMLSQIQLRDVELQKAQDVLEERVKERTADLQASEERFLSAFEHAATGMALVSIKGTWLKVNHAVCETLGYTAEELALKTFQDLTHPDDLASDLNNMERLLAGETRFYHMEKRYFHKQGRIVWVLLGVSLVRDTQGEPVHFISQIQDITERKRADAQLRQTEEMYRRAISGVGAVPYSYSYETKSYSFMGDGIETLVGYGPHEICGAIWKEIVQESVMVGEAAGLDKTEAARRAWDGRVRHWRCDMRVRTRDGRLRWISDASVQTLNEAGLPIGSMGILQDITDRKEAEQILRERDEKFHQLADNITDVFWMRSPDMKEVHYVSPAFERIWGLPVKSLYSNPQQWTDSVFPEDRVRVKTAFEKLTQEAPSLDIEYRISRPDGETRWVQVRGFQVRDAAGELVRLTGIVTDITARKQAEISAQAFSNLGMSLSCATSFTEAAKVIGTAADSLFGWDAFWVKLYNAKDDMMYSEFNADTVDGKRIEYEVEAASKPTVLYRRILELGGQLILRESDNDTVPGAVSFGNKSRLSASLMFVPIRSRSQVVGMLSVQTYTANAYDEHDLNLLQALADQCGGVYERLWADEAQLKAESQFRLVWNASADGMRLTNREGIVLSVNDAFCQMVGKERGQMEGKPLSIIHHEENVERVLVRHRENLSPDTLQSHLEKEVKLWDGRKLWFELSNSILRLPGQPQLLLSIFRDITQRKQAEATLGIMHTQLLDTSRQAGMAEVATSVLHNVGNVLNSVNVSSSLIREKIKKSRVQNLKRVVSIFDEHATDLPAFFDCDPRGKQLPNYLSQLSTHLSREQEEVLQEVTSLVNNIEHIKEIVTMQQSYAKVSGVSEMLQITDLIEDALRMNAGALERHQIRVVREFANVPPMLVEKHKILQILVNLMRNAKHALDDGESDNKELRLRLEESEQKSIRISVIDNGVGIPAENLTRIFAHGFTTRSNGHGFGLHSGALAAMEMGGSLACHSDGLGHGAVFTLEIPLTT